MELRSWKVGQFWLKMNRLLMKHPLWLQQKEVRTELIVSLLQGQELKKAEVKEK